MCGIAGMLRLDGAPADAAAVEVMLDAVRHRGPDGRGTFVEGACALGHVRLSVIDLSAHADQPMRSADGEGVLVYNGEVYNFPALRRELEAEGATFTSTGDATVVLEALHRWGPERAVPRFDGMFAFAYLDRRDGALWMARDRLGIKSLSWTEAGGALLFCSEVKGLLTHSAVPRAVDRPSVDRYLVYGRHPSRSSMLEGIDVLPPGTIRCHQGGRARSVRYHEIPRDLDLDRLRRAGVDRRAATAAVQAGLEASVRTHLVSDAPLAAMCSGGVDSSLITAIAHEAQPGLEAYVADVGGPVSERAQAERVGRHLGVPVHVVDVGREAFLRLWPEVTWYRDDPSLHPSDGPLLAVARTCRERGIKVLLTGEGADELFGGYPWYRQSWSLWRRARIRSRLPWPFRRPWNTHWRRWRGLAHAGVVARNDRHLRTRLAVAFGASIEAQRERIRERLAPVEPPEDRAFLAHQYDDLYGHLAWILHRHDRVAMGASIEMRVPFLQNDLMDLAFHLPRRLKLHRGRGKWVLKQVAQQRLPKNVVHATKKGFPVPRTSFLGTAGLLDGGFVQDLLRWSDEETRRLRAAIERTGMGYAVVSLEVWGRLFVRGDSTDAVAEALLTSA